MVGQGSLELVPEHAQEVRFRGNAHLSVLREVRAELRWDVVHGEVVVQLLVSLALNVVAEAVASSIHPGSVKTK